MRKFLSMVLVTVLLISCMTLAAFASNPGDTVTVTYSVSGNPGFVTYGAQISWADGLKLTGITEGSLTAGKGAFSGNPGNGKVGFFSMGDAITGDGVLFTATFEIDKDAEPGDYNVSVSLDESATSGESGLVSISISGDKGKITVDKPECKHENTEIINKKDATCTEEGNTGDTYCNDCNTTIAYGDKIPAKGHSYEISGAKEATCKEEGYTGDKHCTVCGNDEKGTTIPKTEHQNIETRDEKEANCTEEGYTGDTWCLDCGQKIKDGEVIPTNGEHKVEKWTKYDDKTHVGECSRCGEPMEENHVWDNGGTSCIKCEYQKPGTKVDKDLDDVPKTGDITPMIVGAVVIFIAMAGAVVVIGKRKFVR